MNKVSQPFKWFLLILVVFCFSAGAQTNAVYKQTVDKPLSDVYDNVYQSLEDAHFYVVFEPNIGKSLSGFAEKWGNEYNQNNLTGLRSMVFCNGWYANQVSNKDIDMLGLCPLHLSLMEKAGQTTVLFNRPTIVATGSPALGIIREIEHKVIAAIKKGMQ